MRRLIFSLLFSRNYEVVWGGWGSSGLASPSPVSGRLVFHAAAGRRGVRRRRRCIIAAGLLLVSLPTFFYRDFFSPSPPGGGEDERNFRE